MNRAVLSLPLVMSAMSTVSAAQALACNGKITRAECSAMLDRYIDMTAASEPSSSLRKSDPRYVRAQEQCEAEITRREYRCAMKAPSPETWQACID